MKVLISAGPTREYIDPVRFISNPSTGKMGYLIAERCLERGHEVLLVTGPTFLDPPLEARVIRIETASDMMDAVLKNFPDYDVLIMSAAVSDWRPASKSSLKIKNKKAWTLELVPNADILKNAGRIKENHQKIIGFALETNDMAANAERKLKGKNLDLIVADTPAFFDASTPSEVVFISRHGVVGRPAKLMKEQVARKVVALMEKL